ncbi:MAG: M3 family oligoendopeptidase [Patescibacteria group bacterium]
MKKIPKNNKKAESRIWNLGLLYSSATDPQIEKDVVAFEGIVESFAQQFEPKEGSVKSFLSDNSTLLEALKQYEKIAANSAIRAMRYFHFIKDTNASSTFASAQYDLLENRLTSASNKITFFGVLLGKVSNSRQKEILSNDVFSHFKVFLERLFDDAKHTLTVSEEKILNLKSLPGHSMWVSATSRILNVKSVKWQNKELPLAAAMQKIATLPTTSQRKKLAGLVNEAWKTVAPVAEAEINAIFTNKKIDDELRGFPEPYSGTVLSYRNDPKVVDQLRKVVTDHVHISHDFHRLKARLLKQKKLGYYDRAAKIGATKSTYPFDETISKLKNIFGKLNPKFSDILDSYIKNGQMDVFPRAGKRSGAYCASAFGNPTFVLLNHTDNLYSFMTCAHELGHAIHGELSEGQGALYCDYSYSTAETASTLFEAIGFEGIYDSLSDKEKIIALHDRINDDVATIFRQIAGFNFELELHKTIRAKGYISKEEIVDIHNKNMSAYLGPVFDLTKDDGYFFVTWEHIRYFFYMYTYAYGTLVSKALLRKYRKDPSFWKNIEKFLLAGGKDSPENIFKEIGIDVSSPEFFKEGLMEIADDIKELDRLTKKHVRA